MTRVLFQLADAGIGGGQLVAARVAEALVEAGHETGLLVPAAGPASERFAALGTDVVHVSLGSLRRPFDVRAAARVLGDYDVLYSHTSVPGAILGGAAARQARRPHVVHQHAMPYLSNRAPIRRMQAALYASALRRATVVAVAAHIRDQLVRLGVPAADIAVVANGVPAAPVPEPRSGPPVVGMLARLDPGKNVHVFVQAAAQLDGGIRRIAGISPGPFAAYEQEIRAAAPGAGVELVEPDDGVAFLAGLDVVAIPSASEGSPLVLLEAMALGRAVVASDIPGIREMLAPEEAGVLVPPGDSVALAAAIRELLAHDARRAELGRRASEVVATRYGLAAMTAHMVKVLEEAARG